MSKLLTATDVQEMLLEFTQLKRNLINNPGTSIDTDSLFDKTKAIQELPYKINKYNMKQYSQFNMYLTDFYDALDEADEEGTNHSVIKAIDCSINAFSMLYVTLLIDSY